MYSNPLSTISIEICGPATQSIRANEYETYYKPSFVNSFKIGKFHLWDLPLFLGQANPSPKVDDLHGLVDLVVMHKKVLIWYRYRIRSLRVLLVVSTVGKARDLEFRTSPHWSLATFLQQFAIRKLNHRIRMQICGRSWKIHRINMM
jgi:hypothetical protein